MHVRRVPISVAILIEILLVIGTFKGYPNAGKLALLNGGILIFSFAKAFYEAKQERDYQRREAMRIDQAYSDVICASSKIGYSDTKTENLEKLAMMVYSVPPHPYFANSLLYKISDLKELVAKETNGAIQAAKNGYEMTDASKERIARIKTIIDKGHV